MAVTKEGGRAFPEPTIGERTILGIPKNFKPTVTKVYEPTVLRCPICVNRFSD